MADKTRKQDSVVPAEVADLIAESGTVQGWIEKLSELREDTTPLVFEKVMTDYRVRLDSVTTKLGEHRSGLESSLKERQSSLDALEGERAERGAELEEAELRHAVGEYDDELFGKKKQEVESELETLDELLTGERKTVGELKSILSSIPGSSPAPPEGASKPEPPAGRWADQPAEEPEPTEAAKTEGAKQTGARAEPPEEPAEARAEAEAQETVLDALEAEAGAESGAPQGSSEDPDYLDELEFLESLSLDEADRFDAVSAMLDEDDSSTGGKK